MVRLDWSTRERRDVMSTDVWVLEFTGPSLGQAQDVVRQHTPIGEMVPTVEPEGRHGYQVISSDYGLISAVQMHVDADGGETILSKR